MTFRSPYGLGEALISPRCCRRDAGLSPPTSIARGPEQRNSTPASAMRFRPFLRRYCPNGMQRHAGTCGLYRWPVQTVAPRRSERRPGGTTARALSSTRPPELGRVSQSSRLPNNVVTLTAHTVLLLRFSFSCRQSATSMRCRSEVACRRYDHLPRSIGLLSCSIDSAPFRLVSHLHKVIRHRSARVLIGC